MSFLFHVLNFLRKRPIFCTTLFWFVIAYLISILLPSFTFHEFILTERPTEEISSEIETSTVILYLVGFLIMLGIVFGWAFLAARSRLIGFISILLLGFSGIYLFNVSLDPVPCQELLCAAVPLFTLLYILEVYFGLIILPLAVARVLTKEPVAFKIFFRNVLISGAVVLLPIFIFSVKGNAFLEVFSSTVKEQVLVEEQRRQEINRAVQEFKSKYHVVVPSYLPSLLNPSVQEHGESKEDNEYYRYHYQCGELGGVTINQVPLKLQKVVLDDWEYVSRQEERLIAGRKVTLIERSSEARGLFSRELLFHTMDLQVSIVYYTEVCPLSETELFKMVESMVVGLPISQSSPTLKIEEIYENQLYKFRFRYPSGWSAREIEPPPYGSQLFVVVYKTKDEYPTDYSPALNVKIGRRTENEFLQTYTRENFQAVKQKDLFLGGRNARLYKMESDNWIEMVVVAEIDGLLYTIENSNEEYPYAFNKITESFEFISP